MDFGGQVGDASISGVMFVKRLVLNLAVNLDVVTSTAEIAL